MLSSRKREGRTPLDIAAMLGAAGLPGIGRSLINHRPPKGSMELAIGRGA